MDWREALQAGAWRVDHHPIAPATEAELSLPAMIDLFEAPLGTAPQDPDRMATVSPIPAEAFAYRGQWVAIRKGRVIAARATLPELRRAPGVKDSDVTCHIPALSTVVFPA